MSNFPQCEICGLPASSKKIVINKRGICSYCAFNRENILDLYNTEKYRQLFEKRIERFRGKYEYDAIVGISGGKDGAYVLHRLVRNYNLRVLAATYDNEFLDETVEENVQKLIEIYKVDHIYYKTGNLKNLYRGILRAVGVPCYACATAGYYMAIRGLLEKRIPLFIHGRSSYQMFRNLTDKTIQSDIFISYIKTNLVEYDAKLIKDVYERSYQIITQMVDNLPVEREEKEELIQEFFLPLTKIKEEFVPEAFAYFLTEKYDEKCIRDTLREQGYIPPPSHQDCKIHNVANYLTALPDGVSVDVLEAACMVRKGTMQKSDLDKLLNIRKQEVESQSEQVKNELQLMCQHLSISQDEIGKYQKWVELMNKFPLLKKMLLILKSLVKNYKR